eukprot:3765259-Rhodomonas_salina.2
MFSTNSGVSTSGLRLLSVKPLNPAGKREPRAQIRRNRADEDREKVPHNLNCNSPGVFERTILDAEYISDRDLVERVRLSHDLAHDVVLCKRACQLLQPLLLANKSLVAVFVGVGTHQARAQPSTCDDANLRLLP